MAPPAGGLLAQTRKLGREPKTSIGMWERGHYCNVGEKRLATYEEKAVILGYTFWKAKEHGKYRNKKTPVMLTMTPIEPKYSHPLPGEGRKRTIRSLRPKTIGERLMLADMTKISK